MEKERRPKILLLEDKKKDRDLIQEVLKENGYEVIPAEDVEDARKKMNPSPDLLLLDIMIGDDPMAGIRFAQELEREGCKIPVIFQTVRGEEGTIIDARKINATRDYFVKPYNLKELVLRIREILVDK